MYIFVYLYQADNGVIQIYHALSLGIKMRLKDTEPAWQLTLSPSYGSLSVISTARLAHLLPDPIFLLPSAS